jgi:hypothetical protein
MNFIEKDNLSGALNRLLYHPRKPVSRMQMRFLAK